MKTTPRPPAEVSSTENVKRNLKSGKNLIDRILAQGPKWASVHYWSKHYSFLRDRDVVRSLEGKRSEAYMWLWLHRPRFSLEHKYKHNIDTNKTKVICANSFELIPWERLRELRVWRKRKRNERLCELRVWNFCCGQRDGTPEVF